MSETYGVIAPDPHIEEELHITDTSLASSEADTGDIFKLPEYNYPPIDNQGSLPTCVGQSVSYCQGYQNIRDVGRRDMKWSWAQVYTHAREYGKISPNVGGAYLRDAVEVIQKCFCERWAWSTLESSVNGWNKNGLRWRSQGYVRCTTFDEVCAAVRNGKPVVFSVAVYGSLAVDSTHTIDLDNIRTSNGKLNPINGYHAMVAIGCGDGVLYIRNSWGETWGLKGYGFMTKRYFDLARRDAYCILDLPDNLVNVQPPVEKKKKFFLLRIVDSILSVLKKIVGR